MNFAKCQCFENVYKEGERLSPQYWNIEKSPFFYGGIKLVRLMIARLTGLLYYKG